MPFIASVSLLKPPFTINQDVTSEFAKELFSEDFHDIKRLMPIFTNSEIKERQFAVPIEWFQKDHSFQERNDLYIKLATEYSAKAISKCLENPIFLKEKVPEQSINALITVSSSGVATPSLDARIMNTLSFSPKTKRIPLWGLGCAGGANGIARGLDYCKAYPTENVLVICVELCSLTFQRNDKTKSNLVGTSLFADGVACALIIGDSSPLKYLLKQPLSPYLLASQSTLMPNSEDVMGWDVKDSGLHVVFSRDIPSIIKKWLKPNVIEFLEANQLSMNEICQFIAHPGGKKIIDAYLEALKIPPQLLEDSKEILQKHGNMSSPTVLYVLEKVMGKSHQNEEFGLMAALGPGFSSELVLLQWREIE